MCQSHAAGKRAAHGHTTYMVMLNIYQKVETTTVYLIARLDRFLVLITALDLPEFDDGKGLTIVDLLRRLHDDAALALEVEEVALA